MHRVLSSECQRTKPSKMLALGLLVDMMYEVMYAKDEIRVLAICPAQCNEHLLTKVIAR